MTPDGTTLNAGLVEQTIGPGGTAMAEGRLYVATRSETVSAGLQQTVTVPPAGLGSEPYGVRYQIWLTVPATDTYRLAVYADDGFILNGQGLTDTNTTTRGPTTTEAYRELTLLPNTIYNFGLTYLNYSAATTNKMQLLWRKGGGALEVVPRESIHARGRRDYYSFAGAVVAMKEGVMSSATRTLTYLHVDHLGSTSLTTNAAGQKVSEQRYRPYGEVRWSSGAGMPTDFTFTSQRAGPAGYVGSLMDYNARFFSPALGRFVSADTIVPGAGNSQAYNRYMYVLGNPLGMTDPSGHGACAGMSNQEFWDCRWYTAHGFTFYQGRGWSVSGDATFEDSGILNDVMKESGFRFVGGDKDWTLQEASLVGSGIVALANRIGSFKRLSALVGNTLHDLIRVSGSFFSDLITAIFDAPARTSPSSADSAIWFADDAFVVGGDDDVRGLAVHEVFHLIDYNMPLRDGLLWESEYFPRGARLSAYAMEDRLGLEYWAEAGADWVYGQRYRYTRDPVGAVRGWNQSLTTDQFDWISRVLRRWGW